MQPTVTNGSHASARELLDTLRQHIERLEAELAKTREENACLRADRDDHRKMLMDQIRHLLTSPEDWENFNPADYSATLDDLLADLHSK